MNNISFIFHFILVCFFFIVVEESISLSIFQDFQISASFQFDIFALAFVFLLFLVFFDVARYFLVSFAFHLFLLTVFEEMFDLVIVIVLVLDILVF